MQQKSWSLDELHTLVKLVNEGVSKQEICILLDRNEKSVFNQYCKIKDYQFERFGYTWTEEEKRDILIMSLKDFRSLYKRGQWETDKFKNDIKFGKPVANKKINPLPYDDKLFIKNKMISNGKIEKIKKNIQISKPIENNKSYNKGCEGKRFVQNQQQHHISGTYPNILTLLGPHPADYIQLLKRFQNDKLNIISYENDEKSYIEQAQYIAKNKLILNQNIRIIQIFESIFSAYAERFIDLDLMKTWNTQKDEIKKLFYSQNKRFPNEKKVFCFSFSWRSELKDSLPDWINNELSNMLGFKVEYIDYIDYNIKQSRRYRLKLENSNYEINMYYYNDGTPMINISIQYI